MFQTLSHYQVRRQIGRPHYKLKIDLRDQRLYRERKMAFACLVRFTCLLCGTFVLFLYTIVCVEMTDREKYNKHFTLCWFTIKCAALYIFLLQQPPS